MAQRSKLWSRLSFHSIGRYSINLSMNSSVIRIRILSIIIPIMYRTFIFYLKNKLKDARFGHPQTQNIRLTFVWHSLASCSKMNSETNVGLKYSRKLVESNSKSLMVVIRVLQKYKQLSYSIPQNYRNFENYFEAIMRTHISSDGSTKCKQAAYTCDLSCRSNLTPNLTSVHWPINQMARRRMMRKRFPLILISWTSWFVNHSSKLIWWKLIKL